MHKLRTILLVPLLLVVTIVAPIAPVVKAHADRVIVLMYHSIGVPPAGADPACFVSERAFRKQMEYLRNNGYSTITLQELSDYIAGRLEAFPNSVVITFDDGYRDNMLAYPILKEMGFKATIFVIGVDYNDKLLKREEMLSMADVFSYETHTSELHSPESPLTYDAWVSDLKVASDNLEAMTGIRPTALAYPMGRHNAEVRRAARDSGIKLAFTTKAGVVHRGDDPLQLKRRGVYGNSMIRFAAIFR